jgi:hypothetical protein
MADPLDEVLRLVAEGTLTAEEAAPVLDALQAARTEEGEDAPSSAGEPGATDRPRAVRIEVSEGGRKVVNLRVPIALGRLGLDRVPGLSTDTVNRIREALDHGLTGPVLVVDEDGDGVRIVLE